MRVGADVNCDIAHAVSRGEGSASRQNCPLRRPPSSTARTNRMPIVSVPLNDPAERGDSVTRPIQQPGAPPGEFQRPRTPRPLFRRVRLETGENEPTYYWDTDGVLFHD